MLPTFKKIIWILVVWHIWWQNPNSEAQKLRLQVIYWRKMYHFNWIWRRCLVQSHEDSSVNLPRSCANTITFNNWNASTTSVAQPMMTRRPSLTQQRQQCRNGSHVCLCHSQTCERCTLRERICSCPIYRVPQCRPSISMTTSFARHRRHDMDYRTSKTSTC